MSDETLAVLLHGNVVGELTQEIPGGDPAFTYTEDYATSGEIALSARLPIQRATFTFGRVLPYLRGLLPENSDVRARWAREFGVTPNDSFGLLGAMGWDCPGAVQFCHPEQLDALAARSHDYVSIGESGIAARLRELGTQAASWTMREEHWSLGGQQEKIALTYLDGQWLEAHGSGATTHILKPGVNSLKHQALVEHLTMRAASFLNIDVAPTEYHRFEDQWAIVITRFDRNVIAGNEVLRIHQEDFTQALGRLPEFKYEASKGPGLQDMAQLITRDSVSLQGDRLGLADFLIINAVAGAPDGHSKNVGLLRTGGGSTIAPLFDLATGLAYESENVDRKIALSIGGERQISRVFRQQWDKAAAVLRIDSDVFISRVNGMAQAFPESFIRAINEVPDAEGIDKIAEQTLPRLVDNAQQIISRL
jgi:serine/threonine-protein kinase HipA